MAFGLRRRERRGLGLPIELLELDAEAAKKQKRVLAHRLAAGESALGASKAEKILDRSVDQYLAERLRYAIAERGRMPGKAFALEFDGARHEIVEQPAFQRR